MITRKGVVNINIRPVSDLRNKYPEIEELVLKEHKIKSFIKIKNDQINVTVAAKDSSPEKANQIMRTIQKEFSEKKYITVKYQ